MTFNKEQDASQDVGSGGETKEETAGKRGEGKKRKRRGGAERKREA